MIDVEEIEITYDKQGRMNYHPEFHFNHGKPFEPVELEYLCKFYESDGAADISFALGRTESTLRSKVNSLKKNGLFEYYKNCNKHW